jgi:resuscitation-promoting factor RpfB
MRLTIAVASTGSAATGTSAVSKAGTVTSHPSKSSVTVKVTKDAKHTVRSSGKPSSPKAPAAPASPQQIAQSQLSSYGWNSGQWTYLYQLWERESGWNSTATNPTSGAYGIAQALPATQMNSVGSNWKSDASTQIKWGMNYIKGRYGNPQAAWAHEESNGWY